MGLKRNDVLNWAFGLGFGIGAAMFAGDLPIHLPSRLLALANGDLNSSSDMHVYKSHRFVSFCLVQCGIFFQN